VLEGTVCQERSLTALTGYEGEDFNAPIGEIQEHTVLRKVLGGRESSTLCRTQNAHSAAGERHLGLFADVVAIGLCFSGVTTNELALGTGTDLPRLKMHTQFKC
jgi:hypothetical protein